MSEFVSIPKKLEPRIPAEFVQQIPRIIWQTMNTNRLPLFMKNYTDTWINLNPEYEYRFCDDNDVIEFLEADFPDYVSPYNKLKFGASKADLWRYLVIYKHGGIYADIDSKCITPLRAWIDPEAPFITQLGVNKDICQWLIMSVPQNPIFLKAAEKVLENIEKNNKKTFYQGFEYSDKKFSFSQNSVPFKSNDEVLGLSGPPVLQKAAEECFIEGSITDLLGHTQVVCVSGASSCQMNGNVSHDTGDAEYKSSYKLLNLKHYNSGLLKIKRKLLKLFSY